MCVCVCVCVVQRWLCVYMWSECGDGWKSGRAGSRGRLCCPPAYPSPQTPMSNDNPVPAYPAQRCLMPAATPHQPPITSTPGCRPPRPCPPPPAAAGPPPPRGPREPPGEAACSPGMKLNTVLPFNTLNYGWSGAGVGGWGWGWGWDLGWGLLVRGSLGGMRSWRRYAAGAQMRRTVCTARGCRRSRRGRGRKCSPESTPDP